MDPHRLLQDQVEAFVRNSPRPVPRHLVADRMRAAGACAAPERLNGAVARLLARGRLTENHQGLSAAPIRPAILVTA